MNKNAVQLQYDANELQDALILELPFQEDKKIDYSGIDRKFFLGCHNVIKKLSVFQKKLLKINAE